ncbi:MAG TPA: hypothetical protein PLC98_14355 [Anaerolineales bacterium]|nr:hypothetical protein [Anaerolineales bacterium]
MAESEMPSRDVIQHPSTEPIVLVGPPESLQGEVLLHNTGAEKLILRDIRLRGDAVTRRAAVADGPTELALRRVILRPGQLRRMPLQLALGPTTPPGEYHAEVQVGESVREIVIHVTEAVRLEIDPDPVIVDNQPGETITKRVVFSNRGNIPLRVGEIGAVVLDEELLNCRAGRAAVMNSGEGMRGLDDLLAEYIRQTRIALNETGLLRVHNTAGPFTLMAGEVRAVDLEFRIPDNLNRRSRYFGLAALYTSNLSIAITPTHGERVKTSTRRRSAE